MGKVLLRHVAPGAVFAKGISWGSISTAGGEDVSTKVFKTGMVKVSSSSSSAMVVEADITATNGVVHAIDTVIQIYLLCTKYQNLYCQNLKMQVCIHMNSALNIIFSIFSNQS